MPNYALYCRNLLTLLDEDLRYVQDATCSSKEYLFLWRIIITLRHIGTYPLNAGLLLGG